MNNEIKVYKDIGYEEKYMAQIIDFQIHNDKIYILKNYSINGNLK